MLKMKTFIPIVTVTFLSLIDFNGAEPCTKPIVTNCLTKEKRSNDETIQIGLLYAASTPSDKVENLFKFICGVASKLPEYKVTIAKMVGATVTIGPKGIECDHQDCGPDRRVACILNYGSTATSCESDIVPEDSITNCLANKYPKNPDESLEYSSNLRCNLGIDIAKLPVVVIDQSLYDPCAALNSEADVLAFVCGFYNGLPGC